MPMCGFNQEMLEGMEQLHQGLNEVSIDNQNSELNTEEEK